MYLTSGFVPYWDEKENAMKARWDDLGALRKYVARYRLEGAEYHQGMAGIFDDAEIVEFRVRPVRVLLHGNIVTVNRGLLKKIHKLK